MSSSPILFAAAAADKPPNIVAAARALLPHLGRSRPLDKRLISSAMEICFNGTDAEGAWSWRDAYDAVEAALVLQMRRLAPQIGRVEDEPGQIAAMLEQLTALAPTHTRRSEEQVELDQFSTPPALAALAVAAAQIRPGDLVLEPSAGTGLMAVVAEACGGVVHLNEISAHRACILDGLFGGAPRTRHDAAYLPDLIRASGSFHAAVTNPPFQHLEAHLEATLRILADGGRMAAIVPARLFEDREALARLERQGSVRAAIVFPERAYAKHGTFVRTGLLILDRVEGESSWAGRPSVCETLAEVAEAVKAVPARLNAQARTFRDVSIEALVQPRARSLNGPSKRFEFLTAATPLAYEVKAWSGEGHDVGLYQAYSPSRVAIVGAKPHPSGLVESAPMASVALPEPTYRPLLPPGLVESGALSEAQLEVGIYAGEAHARMLPGWWRRGDAPQDLLLVPEGTEGAFQLRQGFFLGDGTGCGKGRSGAAQMILDNMARGRRRHVWLSKNEPLIEDARRDWMSVGGSASDIVPLNAWKLGEKVRLDAGVLFVTYATLRQPARAGKVSRLDQLIEALGPDFDGVIIFDESHAMAKAIGGEGSRGLTKPSQQGQAGLALQNLLPNARVLYVSATGATTPENLAYASRLGLWGGPEAPFTTREAFLKAMDSGGVAMMEVVARELKAMGLYIARSLSFEGVEYEPLRHALTPDDVAIWNEWADAYQLIHANLKQALEATGVTSDGKARSGQAKSAVISAFEGSKLRFFASLLGGLKAPSLVRSIRDEALGAGHCAVVQIVSTNEAVLNRRLEQIPPEEWNNLQVDLSPKEYVLDYLRSAFPVQAWKVILDEEGNETIEPLRDKNGALVVSQAAVALREDLIERLACLPGVPSVLDALIDAFGPEAVSEITGRSRRVVTRSGRRVLERRGAHAAKAETDAFMAGTKRVLIFSDAGGTGRSYHADNTAPNRVRRHHYLAEAGWRADAAIQGLGRSHRTNQAVAPLFRPVTTDIQGEKRFISTISRRLDSLGALTKGDRKTAGAGLFTANDNLESEWAVQALGAFYSNLIWGSASCMGADEFEAKTGIGLYDADGSPKSSDALPPINTWLNRVLALRIDDQNRIFGDFQAILDSLLERAAESGKLDRGVEDIEAEDVQLISEEVVRTDAVTGAETRLLAFDVRTRRRILSAADVADRAASSAWRFYVNERTGEAALVQRGITITDDKDRLIKGVKLHRPTKTEVMPAEQFRESAWGKVKEEEAWRAAWTAEVLRTDPWIVRRIGLITGLLLPIWEKIPGNHSLVRRLKAPDGRRWLGREIDGGAIPQLRLQLGLSDVGEMASNPAELMRMVLGEHAEVLLAENLMLRRTLSMGRPRLEVVNGAGHREALKALGCFVEVINFQGRVFAPVDKPEIVAGVLKRWPAVRITAHGQAA